MLLPSLLAACSTPAAPASVELRMRLHPSGHGAESGTVVASHRVATSSLPPPRKRTPVDEAAVVTDAWLASERAYYVAGRLGQPDYGPLISSLAPGSPLVADIVSFLTVLHDAGVIAPSSYRIGNIRLTSVKAAVATLDGCTYDTGSIYRSSGAAAPVALGGGASLTASHVTLHRVGSRWLVWSDISSTASSAKEIGPCHGF